MTGNEYRYGEQESPRGLGGQGPAPAGEGEDIQEPAGPGAGVTGWKPAGEEGHGEWLAGPLSPDRERRRRGGLFWTVLVAAIIGGLVGGTAVWYAIGLWGDAGVRPPVATPPQGTTGSQAPNPPSPPPAASGEAVDFTAVFDYAAPSVVQVVKTAEAFNPWLGVVRQEGSGSGVVLDDRGHVITNYHVVQGADRLVIVLDDGTRVPAEVVSVDPSHDLALLRADLPAGKVRPAKLGDSDAIRVGEPVMAIGYPFGLPKTATTGTISGLHRDNLQAPNGRVIREVIQTDAAINPGNSGGALVNARGEVIGINTAILSNSGAGDSAGFIGIGFAVPINIVRREMDQLLAGGVVRHPWIGIKGLAVDAETARARGLAVDRGIQVIEVIPGSPADEAGLQPAQSQGGIPVGGDVILAVDGREVRDVSELSGYLDTKRVGDRVVLRINRAGRNLDVPVTLEAFPEQLSD
ncbi:MAG TPA: trypsin-like peptidase domain-containing protein [Thermaerobacter sp.]